MTFRFGLYCSLRLAQSDLHITKFFGSLKYAIVLNIDLFIFFPILKLVYQRCLTPPVTLPAIITIEATCFFLINNIRFICGSQIFS